MIARFFLATLVAAICMESAAAMPDVATLELRMNACNLAEVRKAVDEVTLSADSRNEPLLLFYASLGEYNLDRLDKAAFWYTAAELRAQRQQLFEKDGREYLLQATRAVIGARILPELHADPPMARRVLDAVRKWDAAMPDPYRDRPEARSAENAARMRKIDAEIGDLPGRLRATGASLADLQALRKSLKDERQQRCRAGKLDQIEAQSLTKRLQEEVPKLARVNPFLVARAGGEIKRASVAATQSRGSEDVPTRMIVSVEPAKGKTFYAEVDVTVANAPDHRAGASTLTLACVTDLWIGQRQASWKDVCTGDPGAVRPPPSNADLRAFVGLAKAKYPECEWKAGPLPQGASILAAGAYTGRTLGFQIDQSGHEATHIDAVVNARGAPVILVLAAYEPTIWTVARTPQTKIAAVIVSGFHRQVVTGLDEGTPTVVTSRDAPGPCGSFFFSRGRVDGDPVARRLLMRDIDRLYEAKDGKVTIGEPVGNDVGLVFNGTRDLESFRPRNAPLAGQMGLNEAVHSGKLRRATEADVEAWSRYVAENAPRPDEPPVAGDGPPRARWNMAYPAYVVLAPFDLPASLYGAASASFLVPKGVERPRGELDHSRILDFNAPPPMPPVREGRPPGNCGIPGLVVPADAVVFAAGGSGPPLGYRLDGAEGEAHGIDVVVHKPGKPVILMLSSQDSIVWNISRTPDTHVIAAIARGGDRAAVRGLESAVPTRVLERRDSTCGNFFFDRNVPRGLNAASRRWFGRAVDMAYVGASGKLVIGDALPAGARLVATKDERAGAGTVAAGQRALNEAVGAGILRKATRADADAFYEAYIKARGLNREPPGTPGQASIDITDAYVVLRPFEYPAGLDDVGRHGVTFLVPIGLPRPTGKPGVTTMIFDFSRPGAV